jgi:hypothetical protein
MKTGRFVFGYFLGLFFAFSASANSAMVEDVVQALDTREVGEAKIQVDQLYDGVSTPTRESQYLLSRAKSNLNSVRVRALRATPLAYVKKVRASGDAVLILDNENNVFVLHVLEPTPRFSPSLSTMADTFFSL